MPIKFLAAFLLLICQSALATEILEHYQSVRALGMGGVYTYSDSDPGVLFQNPAGLGLIKGVNWRLVDLNVGVNGLQIYNDVKSVGAINGLSSLSSFYGKNVWVGADGYTAMVFPYFGFAAYDNGFTSFRLDNPAYPSMDMNFINDYGIIISGAIPVGPAYLGLSAKRTTRRGGHNAIGPSLLTSINNSTLLSQFQNEGSGYGIDTGIIYQVPAPFKPTVSISWRDAGSTAFIKSAGAAAPDREKDNLVLSTTFNGSVPGLGLSGGLEYRHITDASETLGKKLYMGVELSLLMFDFRAGFYQGYTTYGAGLDLLLMHLDAAMYTVEKGAYPGQTPDQRIQISMTMDLGFDPSFRLLEMGGKKRNLKQRR